jgi:hypothetical protein
MLGIKENINEIFSPATFRWREKKPCFLVKDIVWGVQAKTGKPEHGFTPREENHWR